MTCVDGLLTRRIKFIARFIYWTIKHRSPKHAAWVCEFEGYSWN